MQHVKILTFVINNNNNILGIHGKLVEKWEI